MTPFIKRLCSIFLIAAFGFANAAPAVIDSAAVGLFLPQLLPHRHAPLDYSYDSNGRLIGVSSMGYFKLIYHYDDYGRLVQATATDANGSPLDVFYVDYDDNDRVTAVHDQGHPDAPLFNFQYGGNGSLSEALSNGRL